MAEWDCRREDLNMQYQYTYRTTAFELWQLSMYYTYGSMVGMCNIIFTFAMAALMVSRWNASGVIMKILLIFGLSLFTVIQPCIVYRRAKKQAAGIEQDTTVCFDDSGVHITVGQEKSDIRWGSIKKISKKPTMFVLFSDTTHGFVLTDRVLGKEKKAFYLYVTSKTIHLK